MNSRRRIDHTSSRVIAYPSRGCIGTGCFEGCRRIAAVHESAPGTALPSLRCSKIRHYRAHCGHAADPRKGFQADIRLRLASAASNSAHAASSTRSTVIEAIASRQCGQKAIVPPGAPGAAMFECHG